MGRRVMVAVVVSVLAVGLVPVATAGSGAISLRWDDRAAAELEGVAVGPDGSVVVTGHKVVKSKTKAIVRSYAPDGTEQWAAGWSPEGRASTRGMAVDVGDDGTVAWIGRVYGIHCEGGGWFVEVRTATGAFVGRYVTPGWECGLAEHVADVEVGDDQIVVAGYDHGCCDDPFTDGWIRAFSLEAFPTWTTDFEPPEGTPIEYFERTQGVAIADSGEIYASGWAASEAITEGYIWPGSLVVQKMTSGGGVLWRRVAFEGRYSWATAAGVAVRDQMVMVLGATRPGSVTWGGKAPATTWLARMTTDGAVNWTRTWGEEWPTATHSDDLSIDGQMNTWVVGTRRDPDDRGYDLSLRRIGPAGGLNWHLKDLDTAQYLYGTGVAAIGKSGAAVVGFETEGRNEPGVAGHVWTFGPGPTETSA